MNLGELGQLRLRAGQAPLQLLDPPRLFLVLDEHALQALIEPSEFLAIAAMFLVQPDNHLAQLR